MVRKRINNDIVLTKTLDLSSANKIIVEARPTASNARIVLHHTYSNGILEYQLLAAQQKEVGIYNTCIYYTIPNNSIVGGKETHTIDFCNEFELLPKSQI